MAVIHIPYVTGLLCEATVDAIDEWSDRAVLNALPPDDPYAYGARFADWWERGKTFVIVEQDIVARGYQITELIECPHDWCFIPYGYMGRMMQSGFGCVKFSAKLMAEVPYLGRQAAEHGGLKARQVHWRHLDGAVHRLLTIHRRVQHTHAGEVEHLHPWPAMSSYERQADAR